MTFRMTKIQLLVTIFMNRSMPIAKTVIFNVVTMRKPFQRSPDAQGVPQNESEKRKKNQKPRQMMQNQRMSIRMHQRRGEITKNEQLRKNKCSNVTSAIIKSIMNVCSCIIPINKLNTVSNAHIVFLGHLRRHMLIHLNEKSFICHICGKGFNLFINLNAHLRRHAGYKPHECDVCKATFIDKTRLRLHMRTHTGEV